MPGQVRTAQVIIFLMAAIGFGGVIIQICIGDSYAAGGTTTGYVFCWALAITACFFGTGRNGVRITATVFAVLESLCALVSTTFHADPADLETPGPHFIRMGPGPIGLIIMIAVIVLLYVGSSGRWFKRPSARRG